MGRVWRVHDVVLDLPVALKVVRPDLAVDERFRKLFELELRTAARFTHPHIVPLHDSGVLPDGTPYLGLALAQDGSFANLRTEQTTWEEILRLALELLDALGHLHAYGVLHRDLKPENVLLARILDGRRHVWLADLGLANAASTLARTKGRVEGTPGYMAPEQRLGLPREYGPWTDLFSVGVILWELVTGRLPFDAGRGPLDDPLPPLVPQEGMLVPQGLELLLTNLLDAEPLARYDLCADLTTELLALGPPEVDGSIARLLQRDRVLVGTVAPSAPTPCPITTGYAPSRVSSSPPSALSPLVTLTFPEDDPSRAEQFSQLGVPAWNRPAPTEMPDEVGPESGRGATARGSLALFAMREIPLVAREAERKVLWDAARDVSGDGLSRVVLIVGEKGCGKTRLVDSVVRVLGEGGWAEAVHMNYHRPMDVDDGYAGAARAIIRPWKESRVSLEARLRRRLSRERGVLDDVVVAEAQTLCRWAGFVEPGEDPVAEGFGLREVYRYLEARSWRGASCLVLENVQDAQEEGDGIAIAEAVLQSAHDGEQKRIVVFATLQLDAISRDPELAERVDNLVAGGAVRLDVRRLDRLGTRELLKEYLTLAPDIAESVASRCEGNPLFARQLLMDWASRGWLVKLGGLQYTLARGVDIDAAIPADARALFRARIDELEHRSANPIRFRDTLHLAALCGPSVPRDLLMSIAGPELYAYLCSAGVWVEEGERVRFDHGLLRRAMEEEAQERPDLSTLHRRLGNAWIGHGAVTHTDVSFEVGRNAHAGGDYQLAVAQLLYACEAAWARGRVGELRRAADLAIDCCQRARGLSSFGGWPLVWRARAHEVAGEAQLAADLYAGALKHFESGDDEIGRIEASIGLGWAARRRGDISTAERHYGDAMRRAKDEGELRLEARAIDGLAWIEQQKRNFDGADILFTRVLNRMVSLEDVRGQAEAALGQAFVARRTGSFADADELYREAAENFTAIHDPVGVGRAVLGRGVVARQRLELERAGAFFRECVHIGEDHGATSLLHQARLGLGDLYRLAGDERRALSAYRATQRWAERQDFFELAVQARLLMAQLALEQEDLDTMYAESVVAAKHLERNPGHWLWARYRLVVAVMLALRNDQDGTYRWLWSAEEMGLGDTVDHDNAYLLTVLCHAARAGAWVNTMRLAGRLAVGQWTRLKQPEETRAILDLAASLLGNPR